jgi:branched-chain amino acid transport system ATP-binding protein
MTMLSVRNLEAGYGKLRVLRRVSLHVTAGEIVTIIGANGAGKTTLLHAIAAILPVSGGSVRVGDRDCRGLSAEKIVRAGVSLSPEGRQVFGPMSVEENLLLGAYGRAGAHGKRQRESELGRVYDLFPRLRERRRQLAGTLSGGEQQMLAIGRALMARPRLLMLDEPSMGLAPLIVKDIFSIIETLRDQGNTILLVEQNAKAALSIADRGYVLETGTIIVEGNARELLDNNDVQRAYLGKEYRSIDE